MSPGEGGTTVTQSSVWLTTMSRASERSPSCHVTTSFQGRESVALSLYEPQWLSLSLEEDGYKLLFPLKVQSDTFLANDPGLSRCPLGVPSWINPER